MDLAIKSSGALPDDIAYNVNSGDCGDDMDGQGATATAAKEQTGIRAEQCPSCFYEVSTCSNSDRRRVDGMERSSFQLAEEPERMYRLMFTVDSNFSWKRLNRQAAKVGRPYDEKKSRIPAVEVDLFQENNHRPPRSINAAGNEGHEEERCSETHRTIKKTLLKHNNETRDRDVSMSSRCSMAVRRYGTFWRRAS